MKIFTYGTLMRGFGNHRILAGATFLREVMTEATFTMYSLGHFPCIVKGGTTAIHGEVYDVSQAILDRLDRLEGHPTFYRRQPITLADGSSVDAYVMENASMKAPSFRVIPSGSWK